MTWQKENIKTGKEQGLEDNLLPSFGNFYGESLLPPQRNLEYFKGVDLSIERAVTFAYGTGQSPPVVFPNAAHFQHYGFSGELWEKYQNPECELARINLMLDEHSEIRAFPIEFGPVLKNFTEESNALAFWYSITDEVKHQAKGVYLRTFVSMWNQAEPVYESSATQVNMVPPEHYSTNPEITTMQKGIWEIALKQICKELNDGDFNNLAIFLDLYTRIKDPIAGFPVTEEQVDIFIKLYKQSIGKVNPALRTKQGDAILITQLALESSMQAIPGYKNIFEVRLSDHHELPYINIENIFSLPKGELSYENNVIERIEEIIADIEIHNAALITPLTVSFTHNPTEEVDPYMFLVDGFHRLMSVIALRFLYEHEDEQSLTNEDDILNFCDSNGLVVEWKRDLVNALAALADRKDLITILRKFRHHVKNLVYGKIPALLTHEPSYFTIAVKDSDETGVVLLQPFHQSIYNNLDTPGLAIPPKHQSHGRALGNELKYVMPEIG